MGSIRAGSQAEPHKRVNDIEVRSDGGFSSSSSEDDYVKPQSPKIENQTP
jgi:hypothetical protein